MQYQVVRKFIDLHQKRLEEQVQHNKHSIQNEEDKMKEGGDTKYMDTDKGNLMNLKENVPLEVNDVDNSHTISDDQKNSTPCPTLQHAHPYYEKAYMRATKSDRKQVSLSHNEYNRKIAIQLNRHLQIWHR